jgi:hypothetical protein
VGQYPSTPAWRQAKALALVVPHRKNKKAIAHKLIEVIKQALQGVPHG